MFLSGNINRHMLNNTFNSLTKLNDWQVASKNPFLVLNLAISDHGKYFRSLTNMKPPNILVYCKTTEFINIKHTISKVINPDRYVIYHLQESKMIDSVWCDNTQLLFIKKSRIDKNIAKQIINFFQNGGKILTIDLSYFHRFFLDLTSRKIDETSDKPIKKLKTINYKGNRVKLLAIQPQFVWNLEEDYEPLAVDRLEKPLIFAKKDEDTGGVFVSSLVDLEYDAERKTVRDEWYDDLTKSNEIRMKMLKDVLAECLGVDCSPVQSLPLTPCYLLGERKVIAEFIAQMSSPPASHKLKTHFVSMEFHNEKELQLKVTADQLPVIYNCTQIDEFSLNKYLSHLKSKQMGQVVFFTQVLPSTMNVVSGLTDHSKVIAIAKRQTQGKGRSGNDWLSPDGCAMFSIPMTLNRHTELGIHPTWLQHLGALAMVDSVLNTPNYEDLDVRIKWPNDIYTGKNKMKIGGVIVTCTLINDTLHCVVGCGLNVSNSVPTTCLNDLILHHNLTHPSEPPLESFTVEEIIAKIVSRLEELIEEFQKYGYEKIVSLYCKRWMHNGEDVNLQDGRRVQILSLDSNGFLTVLDNGEIISLQSADWNSFDLMRNLITCKH